MLIFSPLAPFVTATHGRMMKARRGGLLAITFFRLKKLFNSFFFGERFNWKSQKYRNCCAINYRELTFDLATRKMNRRLNRLTRECAAGRRGENWEINATNDQLPSIKFSSIQQQKIYIIFIYLWNNRFDFKLFIFNFAGGSQFR